MSLRAPSLVLLASLATGCARLLGLDELSFDEGPSCSADECDDANDQTPDAAADAAVAMQCTSHRECTPNGWDEPRVCSRGTCVDLKNDSGCEVVLGEENLQRDTPPFVVGLLAGLPFEQFLDSISYALVLSEFTRTGLEVGGQSVLPVGVVCDVFHRETRKALDRNIDHLVETLGVSVIISGLQSIELKRSFERTHSTQGHDVFFLSPFESDPALTAIDDDGLLWHMLPSALELAPTYLALTNRTEDYLQRRQGADPSRPLKLALVESNTPGHAELGAYLDRNLMLNGIAARDNDADSYLRLRMESRQINEFATRTAEIERLLAFEPDLIVAATEADFVGALLLPLEINRSEGVEGPFYVLPSAALNALGSADVAATLPPYAQRVVGVGVASAGDDTLTRDFSSNLESEFPGIDAYSARNFYDAAYFALYVAAAASGTPSLSGRSLADGMLRLIDGMRFDVGASDIPSALNYLRKPGNAMALHGTLGPPTFDPTSGARHGQGSVWCLRAVDGALVSERDVLRLAAGGDTLEGELPCIDGF